MTSYDINLDDKFGQSGVIDIPAEAAAHEPWFNQTLTTVNDAVVRLGILEGDFHWHSHDDEDEFFLVLDGRLMIDIEGRRRSPSSRIRATRFRGGSSIGRALPAARRSSWSSRPGWCRPATENRCCARIPCYAESVANLTLSIDDDVLRLARIRALEQNTSVNALVRDYLEDLADDPEGLERERRALEAIGERARRSTASSGPEGRTWTREEIYDRFDGRF